MNYQIHVFNLIHDLFDINRCFFNDFKQKNNKRFDYFLQKF